MTPPPASSQTAPSPGAVLVLGESEAAKAIEYHPKHAYRKLRICSLGELIRLFAVASPPQERGPA